MTLKEDKEKLLRWKVESGMSEASVGSESARGLNMGTSSVV